MEIALANNRISIKEDRFRLIALAFIEFVFLGYKITNSLVLFGIGALFLALLLLFMEPESVFMSMLFLIPSVSLMKFTDDGAALLSYIFLLVEIKCLFFGFNKVKFYKPLIVFIICIFVTFVIYFDISILLSSIRFVTMMLFLFALFNEIKIENLRNKAIDSFVLGTVLNIIIGILFYVLNGLNIMDGMFEGVSLDRNFYSAVIAIAISFGVMRFTTTRKPLLYVIILGILLIGGLLSGSRTFLLSLVFPFLAVIILLLSNKKGRRFVPFIIAGLVAVLIAWSFVYKIINNVLSRFLLEDVSSGNGRFDAWAFYLKQFTKTPISILFGCSSKRELYYSDTYYYGLYPIVEHNTLIQSLDEIGLCGTLAMVACYFCLFKNNKRFVINKKVVSFMPLLTVVFVFLFINQSLSDTLTLLISLSAIFLIKSKSLNAGTLNADSSN